MQKKELNIVERAAVCYNTHTKRREFFSECVGGLSQIQKYTMKEKNATPFSFEKRIALEKRLRSMAIAPAI